MGILLVMNPIEHLIQNISSIEAALGYTFRDRSLLTLAFVHRSFINENRDVTEHNERLEFLGDSILGLLISDYLYRTLPDIPEGDLSSFRSRLVDANSCFKYVQTFHLEQYILLGKGEKHNDGRGRESILADLFEALIGAIYLDGGIDAVRNFFFAHFLESIQEILSQPQCNWKALLQDFCQRKYQQTPDYSVISAEGPDHGKIFTIAVLVDGQELGRGTGASKKEAQQAAAGDAISRLDPTEQKRC